MQCKSMPKSQMFQSSPMWEIAGLHPAQPLIPLLFVINLYYRLFYLVALFRILGALLLLPTFSIRPLRLQLLEEHTPSDLFVAAQ